MTETTGTNNDSNDSYGKKSLWKWLLIYFVIGIIIYAIVYFFFLNKDGYNSNQSSMQYASPSPSVTVPSPSAMMAAIILPLAEVNTSGESGTTTLEEVDGKTKITITLTGFTKDVEQPAHIHIGECPGVGAVKYPLTNVVNGESITLLPVTLEDLKKQLPLAINIHKSQAEVNVYTACGPLTLE